MTGWSIRVRAARAARRFLLLLPLIALAGCQTAISARVGADFSLEQMRAEGNSMALFHTSLHNSGGCRAITIVVATPDGEGR